MIKNKPDRTNKLNKEFQSNFETLKKVAIKGAVVELPHCHSQGVETAGFWMELYCHSYRVETDSDHVAIPIELKQQDFE